jgi:Transmembrane secretion effector
MWSVSIFRNNDPFCEHCLTHDFEHAGRYVGTFVVSSWAEHLRQHERMTRADREPQERWQRYSPSNPRVRHLVSVAMDQ